jgi:flagellar biosynthesis chaperone FliJ
MYPTILPYLERQLKLNIRAKQKAYESFHEGRIRSDLLRQYVTNLNKLIKEYESAIKKLKDD